MTSLLGKAGGLFPCNDLPSALVRKAQMLAGEHVAKGPAQLGKHAADKNCRHRITEGPE